MEAGKLKIGNVAKAIVNYNLMQPRPEGRGKPYNCSEHLPGRVVGSLWRLMAEPFGRVRSDLFLISAHFKKIPKKLISRRYFPETGIPKLKTGVMP